jgi:uncharacterized protein (DUF3084 family)
MEELMKVLDNAKAVLAGLIETQRAVKKTQGELDAKGKELAAQEKRLVEAAKGLQVREELVNARATRVDMTLDLYTERNKVEQKEADVENKRASMLQDVQMIKAEASSLLQEAKQIKESAISLRNQVEKEKAEYKTKILEEITKKVGK